MQNTFKRFGINSEMFLIFSSHSGITHSSLGIRPTLSLLLKTSFVPDVLPSHINFDGFGTVFYKSLRFFRLNSTLLNLISGKMLEIPNTVDVRKSLSFKSD